MMRQPPTFLQGAINQSQPASQALPTPLPPSPRRHGDGQSLHSGYGEAFFVVVDLSPGAITQYSWRRISEVLMQGVDGTELAALLQRGEDNVEDE